MIAYLTHKETHIQKCHETGKDKVRLETTYVSKARGPSPNTAQQWAGRKKRAVQKQDRSKEIPMRLIQAAHSVSIEPGPTAHSCLPGRLLVSSSTAKPRVWHKPGA